MVNEAILYHSVMIKMFLGLLFLNLILPSLFKSDIHREVKATRISFYLFSALLSMMAFTGTIVYMLMDIPWNIGLSLMVFAFIVLAAIEIMRSRKLVGVWVQGESGVRYSWPYVLSEIVITAAVVLYMIIEKKDAVPL